MFEIDAWSESKKQKMALLIAQQSLGLTQQNILALFDRKGRYLESYAREVLEVMEGLYRIGESRDWMQREQRGESALLDEQAILSGVSPDIISSVNPHKENSRQAYQEFLLMLGDQIVVTLQEVQYPQVGIAIAHSSIPFSLPACRKSHEEEVRLWNESKSFGSTCGISYPNEDKRFAAQLAKHTATLPVNYHFFTQEHIAKIKKILPPIDIPEYQETALIGALLPRMNRENILLSTSAQVLEEDRHYYKYWIPVMNTGKIYDVTLDNARSFEGTLLLARDL